MRVADIFHNYAEKQHIKNVCLIKLTYIITEIVQVEKKNYMCKTWKCDKKDKLLKLARNNK